MSNVICFAIGTVIGAVCVFEVLLCMTNKGGDGLDE